MRENPSLTKQGRWAVAKVQYRVKNRNEYNEVLKERVRPALWLSADVLQSWAGEKTGKRGVPPTYSAP